MSTRPWLFYLRTRAAIDGDCRLDRQRYNSLRKNAERSVPAGERCFMHETDIGDVSCVRLLTLGKQAAEGTKVTECNSGDDGVETQTRTAQTTLCILWWYFLYYRRRPRDWAGSWKDIDLCAKETNSVGIREGRAEV
jgi:hypothetical protein